MWDGQSVALPTLDAVGFAFVTAIFWGLSPVVAKRGLERGGTTVQAALVVILTTSVMVWTVLVSTHGSAAFDGFTLTDVGLFVVGGVIGTTVGRLCNYAGVRRVGASVTTGVMNTRPVFVLILAVVLLRETVTVLTVGGVALLVLGVLTLSLSRGGDIGGWRTIELAFPLGAALSFGAGNVIRRYGFQQTPATTIEAVTINESAALVTLGVYFLFFRRGELHGADRGAIQYFVASGLVSGLGLISFFQALSLGNVSVVDPIMGMAPLFATLFTFLLLREVEVVTRGVVFGAALIVLGGGLVSL